MQAPCTAGLAGPDFDSSSPLADGVCGSEGAPSRSLQVVWKDLFECVCLGPMVFLHFGPIEARRLSLACKWSRHVATELDKFNPRVRVYSMVQHHPASSTDSGLPVLEAKRNVEIVYGVVQRVVSETAVVADVNCRPESTRKQLEMAVEARRLSGADHTTLVEETRRRSRELLTPDKVLWTRLWTVNLERIADYFMTLDNINVLTADYLTSEMVLKCVLRGLSLHDHDQVYDDTGHPTRWNLEMCPGTPGARARIGAKAVLLRYELQHMGKAPGLCVWLRQDLEQIHGSNHYRLRTANPNQLARLSARYGDQGFSMFESEDSVLAGCIWRSTVATRSNGKMHIYAPTIVDAAVFDREVGVRHLIERAHVGRWAHNPSGDCLPTAENQKIKALMQDSAQLGWEDRLFNMFFRSYNVLIEALCIARTIGIFFDAENYFHEEYEGIDAFVRAGTILRDGQSMQLDKHCGIDAERPWCWFDAFAHNVGVVAAPSLRPPIHFEGMDPLDAAPPAISVEASHEFFEADADREWIERTPFRPGLGLGQSAILQVVRMHMNETTGEYEPGEVLDVPDQRIGASSIREESEQAYPDNEDMFPVAKWPLGGLRLTGKHRGNRTTNLPTGKEAISSEVADEFRGSSVDTDGRRTRSDFLERLYIRNMASIECSHPTKPWFSTNRDPLFTHDDGHARDRLFKYYGEVRYAASCTRIGVWDYEDVGVRKLAVRTRFSLPSVPRPTGSKKPTVLAIRITVATPPHLTSDPFPVYTSTLTAPFELRVKAPKRRLDGSVA